MNSTFPPRPAAEYLAASNSSPRSPRPSSPAQLGYRMPAEWEFHQATWLSWPHNSNTWLCGLEEIYTSYAELVRAVTADEVVHINVNDGKMERLARDVLSTCSVGGDIHFHHFPTDDAWCRDHGAVVLVHRSRDVPFPTRIAVDWAYNAWGGKYEPYDNDNAIPNRMARELGIPIVAGGMILEGGSIDVNGAGVLLTTETCLLHKNRNPHLNRQQIESRLCDMLGVEHVIWLSGEIAGDDTDGHVDCLARFVDTHTVVTAVEVDSNNENFDVLQSNLQRLNQTQLPGGEHLTVVTLPMPKAVTFQSRQLPATYLNFYVTNHSVIVPTFDQPSDDIAKEMFADLFPGRRVVGVDCRALITGLGAVHCLTQQVPA